MELTKKNILLVSPEPWNHIFVSKHHYATHLGQRGNKVFYLNPPANRKEINRTPFINVFDVHYKGFPIGLRYYPNAFQRKIIRSVFETLEAFCSVEFDVVWSFDNSVFFDFSSFPSRVLTISHIVDYNQNFQLKKSAGTANVCFCTTEVIKEKLRLYNNNVFKINHGFSGSTRGLKKDQNHERVRVVYSGNLAIPSIDWCVLLDVVTLNPQVDFVFVGPNAKVLSSDRLYRFAKSKVLEMPNAHFLGAVAAADLQNIYHSADVLLIAYQERYQAYQVGNPHKLMEYLGSGKVILATRTLEFLGWHPLIVMSERNSEWVDLFSKVIANLEFYNARGLQAERQKVAFDHSYEKQIRNIENILKHA